MTELVQEHRLTVDKVKRIDIHLPPMGAQIVNNRAMPDINCQYIVAVLVVDGQVTFKAAHSYERMLDPKVRAVEARVNLIGDPQFSGQEKQRPGLVRVHLEDGRIVEKLVPAVRGTADNPMTRAEIETKSQDLLQDVLGTKRANSLIKSIWELDNMNSMRDLRPLLCVP
jgi:2-methylcitrate dehydratase PrpD